MKLDQRSTVFHLATMHSCYSLVSLLKAHSFCFENNLQVLFFSFHLGADDLNVSLV